MYFSGHLLVIINLNNVKSTVGGEFLFVVSVEAYNFRDLGGCANGLDKSGFSICGWC